MRRACVAFALCVALAGCGSTPQEPVVDAVAVPLTQVPFDLLSGKNVVDVGDLLQRPRKELADAAADLETKIATLERCRQEGSAPFLLLPDARFPLTVPVFRHAAWSEKHGVSVPDYANDTSRDAALAWHLARHGDHETARKFGDVAAFDRLRLDRNYPHEWTRVVGLHLLHAEYRAAADVKEGVAELISIHRQLRAMLPEATQKSPLGQALLTRGTGVMQDASKAFRERGRADLSDQVDRFVAGLQSPTWTPEVPNLAWSEWLDAKEDAAALQVASPARLLDLLALDLPTEGIDGAFVFPSKDRKAAEVVFTYSPTISHWLTPDQLAPTWKERGRGEYAEAIPEFRRAAYRFGGVTMEMAVTPPQASVGALVRVRYEEPKTTTLPRDFGIVHLDRGFEQGRRMLAWKQRQSSVVASDATTLAAVRHPFAARVLSEAKLERDESHDLLRKATFAFVEQPKQRTTLSQMAADGWKTFGPADIEIVPSNRSIQLVWNDGATRLALQFPAAKHQDVHLEATSISPDIAARREASAKRDADDRANRLAEGKAIRKAPREIEGLKLGMTKAEFTSSLPRTPQTHVQNVGESIVASFVGSPKSPSDALVRQWVGRFDEAGRAVELRVRYEGGAGTKTVESLKAKLGPAEPMASDAATWKDLATARLESKFAWHDDLTLLIVQQGGLTELVIRDCPLDHASGVALAPLSHLPRGTAKVHVGMSLADLQKMGASKLDDGYFVASEDPNYDGFVVWFAGDRALRVVGRHRIEGKELPTPERGMQHLLAAWSRDAAQLGWPWRQDFQGPHAQSWSAIDDLHRVRVFWQEQDSERRLFTEWKLR